MNHSKNQADIRQAQQLIDRLFHLRDEDILQQAKLQKLPDSVINALEIILDKRSRQKTEAGLVTNSTVTQDTFKPFSIDAYQITALIAEGGMSTVYRAHKIDSQAQKDVAIKLIPPHLLTPKLRRLFIDELETLSCLHHPHIVALHHGGVSEKGVPYFVMELLQDAQPITDYIQQNQLTKHAIIDLFITLAKTLDYAHKNHIIHRDLKPNNILVDGFGYLKVVDFGIAAIARQTAPTLAYTQAYSPPEQIQNPQEPVSIAADIYGFSSVFLECLCADNTDFKQGWQRRCLRQSNLDKDLHKIIRKGLAFRAADRYVDFDALITDLSLWKQQLPLASFESSLLDNTRKFMRRQPLASSMLALAFVSLSIGLAAAYWQLDRARQQTAKTEQVRNLLFNAIEQSDPDIRQGRDITVQQMLHQALRNTRENPINDPDLAFEFNHLLGTTLMKAGDFESAISQLTEAYRLRNHDVNNILALAEAHLHLQNYHPAINLLRTIDSQQLMSESLAAVKYHKLQGNIADYQADFSRAANHYQQAFDLAEELKQFQLSSRIVQEQALSLTLQDRNHESLELLTTALKQAQSQWGDNHSATLGLRVARIETLQSLSTEEIKDSLIELDKLIPELEQFYHPQHPLVAKMRLFQASANQAMGQLEKAHDQAQLALDIALESLGANHALTGRIYMLEARVLLAQGKMDAALEKSHEAVNSYRRYYGENHHETLQFKTSYAAILLQQKHYAEALKQAQDIYQQQSQTLGDGHRATQYVQMVIARAYIGLEHYPEAEQHAYNCYQNALQAVDADSRLAVGCALALESAYFEQEKWHEAKSMAHKLLTTATIQNHPTYPALLEQHLQKINSIISDTE